VRIKNAGIVCDPFHVSQIDTPFPKVVNRYHPAVEIAVNGHNPEPKFTSPFAKRSAIA
jgi:hypothetical protein